MATDKHLCEEHFKNGLKEYFKTPRRFKNGYENLLERLRHQLISSGEIKETQIGEGFYATFRYETVEESEATQ